MLGQIGRGATRSPCGLLVLIWILGSCGDRDPRVDRIQADQADPDRPRLPTGLFERVGTVTLEEDSSVINVSPRVTVASGGSFLIADSREAHVRIYGRDGSLVNQFGRRGDGPGEMRMPMHAERMPGGTLGVLDFTGLIMDFTPTGEEFLRRVQSPITPLYGGQVLSAQRLLIAGMRLGSEEPRPLLHIWDRDSEAITISFFPTPGDSLVRLASRNFGWADFAIRGDTIAAIATFTDTLFLFTPDGEEIDQIPLPFAAFRRMEGYDSRLPAELLQEWLGQLDLLTDIFWLDDGSLLVQYERPRDADESEWGLLRTTPGGDRVFEIANTPRVLAVSGDHLYFVDPSSLTPNLLLAARIRR